jgi:hypothetical protein
MIKMQPLQSSPRKIPNYKKGRFFLQQAPRNKKILCNQVPEHLCPSLAGVLKAQPPRNKGLEGPRDSYKKRQVQDKDAAFAI